MDNSQNVELRITKDNATSNSKFEQGETPSNDAIARICTFFIVPFSYLH